MLITRTKPESLRLSKNTFQLNKRQVTIITKKIELNPTNCIVLSISKFDEYYKERRVKSVQCYK